MSIYWCQSYLCITYYKKLFNPHKRHKQNHQDILGLSPAASKVFKMAPNSPDLVKFPRTPHLANLGAATRDDLVLTESDALAILDAGVVLGKRTGRNLRVLL